MSHEEGESKVRLDVDASTGIAELVLCQGSRYNVMGEAFFRQLGEAVARAGQDERVRVILLWAEGRVFTAGLDLKEAATSGPLAAGSAVESESAAVKNLHLYHLVRRWQEWVSALSTCPKPTIAAIHGKCIGGGVDVVSAADMRIATRDATFSIRETKIGLTADLGTLQRIARVCSEGMAREMAFTGDDYTADQMLQAGFLNCVYENHSELLRAGRSLAARIAGNSPLIVQSTKMVMNYAREHPEADALNHVAMWNSAFLQSDDLVEGMMSFIQKRPPKWKNRL